VLTFICTERHGAEQEQQYKRQCEGVRPYLRLIYATQRTWRGWIRMFTWSLRFASRKRVSAFRTFLAVNHRYELPRC
jgi:sigma54-dependent transcription regulator